MKTALKVMSLVGIVLGGLALLGVATQPTLEEAMYTLIGGGYVLAFGIIGYASQKRMA